MNSFICLVNRKSHTVGPDVRERYTPNSESWEAQEQWVSAGPCSVWMRDDGYGPAVTLVHSAAGIAVGMVRLDNRREISRLARCDAAASDLAIIVAALHQIGPSCVRQLEGDFAFAYWDREHDRTIVARDAFGVRLLFRSEDDDVVAFASRCGLLGRDAPLSHAYFADFLANARSLNRSPYEGVLRVPPSTYHLLAGGNESTHRYWSPYGFEIAPGRDAAGMIEQFATLFKDAVRVRLTGSGDCWAQLSGGLDSSSVVSTAQWLAQADPTIRGLAGTVTFVDRLATGDEREFSDTVIRDWPVRNDQWIDSGLWQETDEAPPMIDDPDEQFVFFALEQQLCRRVRAAGGRVLLTGVGSDQYLGGNWLFFADWLTRGHIRKTVQEVYRLAVRGRLSFWRVLYENALRPLVGQTSMTAETWPAWVRPDFASRFPMEDRSWRHVRRAAPAGQHFSTEIANSLYPMEHAMQRGLVGEMLDVRHPFLHRPLVEFCLRLPPEMIIRHRERKWILRQALSGILPQEVRRRVHKGYIDGRMLRSMVEAKGRLDELLRNSILGELGIIDVPRARQLLARFTGGETQHDDRLNNLLVLETWLSMRSGRWTARATA